MYVDIDDVIDMCRCFPANINNNGRHRTERFTDARFCHLSPSYIPHIAVSLIRTAEKQ